MRVLIIYATDEGQTEKIATRIAARLSEKQFPSDRHNIALDPETPIAIDAYDAVIVGSPIHYSHYDARLAEYLRHFHEALREIPSAFFSVSLGILSDQESEQEEIRKITGAYLAETEWNPPIKMHFGGALTYSKYGWLKRRLMKLVVRKAGGPTDTQFDYEFTNWPQVDAFADQFVAFVESCKQPDEEYTQRSIYTKPTRRYALINRRLRSTVEPA